MNPSLKDSENRKAEGDCGKEEKEEEKFSIESSFENVLIVDWKIDRILFGSNAYSFCGSM